ncbi:MAG: ergothioneine biosynthesis protein EgtB [Ignavibacteria bacterium]|nr:MAG: ergothioneine biosynthesis protein EgtB [Ignavibacteria bacterium]
MDSTGQPTGVVPGSNLTDLIGQYQRVRAFTEELCRPLQTEDYVIQTMPDVSPTKWHLAHTSWFFEAFLLAEHQPSYASPDPLYNYLFNSYYIQIGERFHRPDRGLLSRPTVDEVYRYRRHVDEAVLTLLDAADEQLLAKAAPVIILGLHHEQQHQELLLTDIKHVLSVNPMHPVYARPAATDTAGVKNDAHVAIPPLQWIAFEGGLKEFGHAGEGFFYDNEGPHHQAFVQPFALASRPVTAGEYMEFIEDDGYQRAELWLSDGAAVVEAEGWSAPLYWKKVDGRWHHFTLRGWESVDTAEPVTHVSLYEADAYARWKGWRLPSEFEWELAADGLPVHGNFVDDNRYHPAENATTARGLQQLYGDVWEWTRSPYAPYPGYVPPPGAVGEYNGKFMSSQMVLRGGSCASSRDHLRPTYRNFFPPHARWQFMGIRLAQDSGDKV